MEPKEPQKVFCIHNTTRDPKTREIRRRVPGPQHSTKNLFIGGQVRVVRGRPVVVSEDFIRKNMQDLLDKESKGLVAVYTHNSLRVDLRTLSPVVTAPPPAQEDIGSAIDTEDTIPNDEISCEDDAPLKQLAEDALGLGDQVLPVATSVEMTPVPAFEAPTVSEVPAPLGRKRRR